MAEQRAQGESVKGGELKRVKKVGWSCGVRQKMDHRSLIGIGKRFVFLLTAKQSYKGVLAGKWHFLKISLHLL